MRKYILLGGEWIDYDKALLKREEGYKFVAWVNSKENDTLLVISEDLRHSCAVNRAKDRWLVEEVEPNVYGCIRVLFDGQCAVNRIVSWNSKSYGGTHDNLRQTVREALGLGDVVYMNSE